jgi:hypothetical protein
MKSKGFSPTNKGARLIKGDTIHSIYHKYSSRKQKFFDQLKEVDYIFIDEVSMMIAEFYKLFVLIKRAFPAIKFIISGDFGQLPPVCDKWEGDYENSPALHMLCSGNRIQLTICRRSDARLFNLCKRIGELDFENKTYTDLMPTEKTYLNLAYTHRTRMRVNNECMKRYLTEHPQLKTVSIPKTKANTHTQNVILCSGMPIIAHTTFRKTRVNKQAFDILNSQTFTIHSVGDDVITIKDDQDTMEIKTTDFHKMFYLGFCITVHASQGETFTTKYTIYDINFPHFSDKAKYVAFSRGTKIENIQVYQS